MPWVSCHRILIRSPRRPRKTKRWPEYGSRSSTSWTWSASLPDDLAAAHAAILLERAARLAAEERASAAEAGMSGARLEIERLKLLLTKTRR